MSAITVGDAFVNLAKRTIGLSNDVNSLVKDLYSAEIKLLELKRRHSRAGRYNVSVRTDLYDDERREINSIYGQVNSPDVEMEMNNPPTGADLDRAELRIRRMMDVDETARTEKEEQRRARQAEYDEMYDDLPVNEFGVVLPPGEEETGMEDACAEAPGAEETAMEDARAEEDGSEEGEEDARSIHEDDRPIHITSFDEGDHPYPHLARLPPPRLTPAGYSYAAAVHLAALLVKEGKMAEDKLSSFLLELGANVQIFDQATAPPASSDEELSIRILIKNTVIVLLEMPLVP